MTRCEKIQELLQADYLDQEAGRKEEQLIKEHLGQCSVCRGLEKKLQIQRAIFQGAKRQQVPERLWNNIRAAIITERLKQKESPITGIFERLRDLIFAPRPAVVFAAAFSVVLMVVVFTNMAVQRQVSLNKQNAAESIAGYSLNGQNGYVLYDLGTSIEEYFL